MINNNNIKKIKKYEKKYIFIGNNRASFLLL